MNATKQRYGADALEELFAGAKKIVVAKGKKVLRFNPQQDELAEISKVALGPTGNLRAPALRLGKFWLIGFHEDAYGEQFD